MKSLAAFITLVLPLLVLGTTARAEDRPTLRPEIADDVILNFGLGAAAIWGRSNTTTGGAAFGGGGTVHDVVFGTGQALHGEIGRRWQGGFLTTVSLEHAEANVRWLTDFPAIADPNVPFVGEVASTRLLLNLGVSEPVDERLSLRLSGGLGLGLNALYGVAEGDPVYGHLGAAARPDLAARASLGADYAVTPAAMLGLTASLDYLGHFKTADVRSVNWQAAPDPITPYELEAWGLSLEANFRLKF